MIIVEPMPIAAIGAGFENLLTPDPKEVWSTGSTALQYVDIDLGEVREVDSVFLGFSNAHPDGVWRIGTATGFGSGVVHVHPPQQFRAADSLGPRHHAFYRHTELIETRYLQIAISLGIAPQIGVLAVGKAFQAPYEFGSGRTPIDTGTKEALLGGGFGIGEGVVKAQLRWTFVDLTPAQRRTLWNLTYRRGETRPVVVVEELGEGEEGLGEEIHYGLFDRSQAYEREAPGQTRWALSMTEWV